MLIKIKTLLILFLLAAIPAAAATVDIREWLVPWENSGPTGAYVDAGGRVWFAGEKGDYVANFSPQSGEFNRYDLRKGTAPTALVVDANRIVWFSSSKRRYIGSLNPATGRVDEFAMPNKKAKDLFAIALGPSGDIWFTVENSNFIGRLGAVRDAAELIELPTKKVRPHGIVLTNDGNAWVAAAGQNLLLRVSQQDMSITEIRTPDKDSRLRRIVATSDDKIWYADHELGNLGRYNPQNGEFTEWALPGGSDSQPYGMAVDRNDRIWVVETGREPNRLVGFDTASETFLTQTDIPSGAGSVTQMHYYEAAGEIWFATESNYIGRAKVD